MQTLVTQTHGVVGFDSAGLPVISNSTPNNARAEYSAPVSPNSPPSNLTDPSIHQHDTASEFESGDFLEQETWRFFLL